MATRCLTLAPVADPATGLHDGVLVLSGYGLQLRMERGHLLVEDGIGVARRQLRFGRLDRELKRVVIIGHAGVITLDAIRWLAGVGVPLVHLDSDGRVFFVAAPSGAIIPTLRRSQALAAETGLGVRLSQDLIVTKVQGQCRVLERLPDSEEARQTIQELLEGIQAATRLPDLRRLEAMAARAYWRAWQALTVRFQARDAKRVPRQWLSFGSRASALTSSQSPRKAVNPANAILNYLYAILEAETRIAVLSSGLDPVLGLLHADERCRDSVVFDVMEPLRPMVDRFVLDFLARHTFSREDVFELLDGQCRLLPPITEQLAGTAALWARLAVPEAQRLAAKLLAAESEQTARAREARALSTSRPRAPRARRARHVVVREYRERVAPETDARRSPAAGMKRRHAMTRVVAANRAWTGSPADPEAFRRGIAPGLKRMKLTALMAATGLSKGACSQIRAGDVVPHARHWAVLETLVGGASVGSAAVVA